MMSGALSPSRKLEVGDLLNFATFTRCGRMSAVQQRELTRHDVHLCGVLLSSSRTLTPLQSLSLDLALTFLSFLLPCPVSISFIFYVSLFISPFLSPSLARHLS